MKASAHSGNDPTLKKYLDEIGKYPVLSAEEEKKLALRAQEGDEKAIDKLIRSNLKFVVKIASEYQNRGLPLSDLISEGNLGLIKGIERFDVSRGNKLISYAVWWIRQSILYALAEKSDLIRLPLNQVNQLGKINQYLNNHSDEHIDFQAMGKDLDIAPQSLRRTYALNNDYVSLNQDIFDGDDEAISYLEDEQTASPEQNHFQRRNLELLAQAIETLDAREKQIITKYFGLNGEERENFVEIGNRLGISRERVRQLKERALEKMRKVYAKFNFAQSFLDNMVA